MTARRSILTCCTLCLLLGFVTSFVVAWTLALVVNSHVGPPHVAAQAHRHWTVSTWTHFGTQVVVSTHHPFSLDTEEAVSAGDALARSVLPRWAPFHSGRSDLDPLLVSMHVDIAEARGWPLLCLSCTRLSESVLMSGDSLSIQTSPGAHYIPTSLTPHTDWHGLPVQRILPLRVIWPGLLINSLCYAAFWLALLCSLRFVRRIRSILRRHAQRCPCCGYSLHGAGGCPECGAGRTAPS
jgi:hypothetical protein